jgi:hypothetical protein
MVESPTNPHELAAIIEPLAQRCAQLRFEYRWRVRRAGERWSASVQAGFPIVKGRVTGPRPEIVMHAATAVAALTIATRAALEHVERYPRGYTGP